MESFHLRCYHPGHDYSYVTEKYFLSFFTTFKILSVKKSEALTSDFLLLIKGRGALNKAIQPKLLLRIGATTGTQAYHHLESPLCSPRTDVGKMW